MTITSECNVDANNYKWIVPKSNYRYPHFSDREYQRRWTLVKSWMKERELDCLIIGGGNVLSDRGWSNMVYLTNYMGTLSPCSYLVFPLEGEPTIIDSRNCAERPDRRAMSIIDDVRWGAYDEGTIERIKELRCEKGNLGIVEIGRESKLPWNHYERFRKELAEAKLDFVTEEFHRLRMQKSPEEIEALERSAKLGDLCIEALVEKVMVGMTESEVFAIVYDTMIKNGGDPESMVLLSTMSMENPDCNMGRRRPIIRTMKRGDIIINEIGPRDGTSYEAQTGKPITLGRPTKEFQDMFDACLEAYNGMKKVLKAGATDAEIRNAAKVVLDRGFHWDTPILHGMSPSGPFASFKTGSNARPIRDPLKPNVAIVVETNACRQDLTAGITLDDTFITTETGSRCLNNYPAKLTEI